MLRRGVAMVWVLLGLQVFAGVDPALPREQPALEGTFAMKGSDSMDPLIRLWVDDFQKANPKVEIRLESRGSGTAPPALTLGEVQLGRSGFLPARRGGQAVRGWVEVEVKP